MAESSSSRRLDNIARHITPNATTISHVPNAPISLSTVSSSSSDPVSCGGESTISRAYHTIFSTLEESERHGGALVAQVLKAHKVQHVFTLSGGHISPILVSAKQVGIRIIDVRHEVTAVFAADAVARLTGVPGVAAVTAGPGVTNTITAVKNAQMAQSPVVLLGGASATIMSGRGALQDIDQESVLRPICKFCYTCRSLREIVPVLRRAFQEALSGVPGPVYVGLPLDILYPITEMKAAFGMTERIKKGQLQSADIKRVILPKEALDKKMSKQQFVDSKNESQPLFLENSGRAGGGEDMSWITRQFLGWKLKDVFAGGFEAAEFGPLPVSIPIHSAKDISRTVSILNSARTPVLLLGSQVMLRAAPDATKLQRAVEKLGMPCFLGGMSRGLMGRNHPLHIRQNRGAALKNADVVILAGAVCDFRLQYGRSLSSKSKVIAVNRSKEDLQLNSDRFWKPTLASQADPCEFLLSLADELSGLHASARTAWSVWTQKLKQQEAAVEARNREKASVAAFGRGKMSGQPLVNPIDLCFQVEDHMKDDSIIVADGGDFVATASYIIRPRGPLRWLDPGAFGTLGVGGGFALGAKLVNPQAEVWLVWGDGSSGYSIAEIDTFKRHGVNVIALIGNDACWSQIEREQVPMFNDNVACPLEYGAYDMVAKGYGGEGILLSHPSVTGDIATRLAEAQSKVKGSPVVINALIGGTDFREGSISV